MEHFDLSSMNFWMTIGMAIVCGAIVGLERQFRGKPAGVRTSILICMGTSIFINLGAASTTSNDDSTRVLAQLITGVGFLGAGVMLSREGVVTGVTTAAVIWVLAAIGSTIGLGYHKAAFVIAIITVGILIGVEYLEISVKRLTRGVHKRE
jgi:putative Mg2+ transporter-C (MgtC) family protein